LVGGLRGIDLGRISLCGVSRLGRDRRRGVRLEIGGGRGRHVGGFGGRHGGIDRQLGGALVGRIGLGQRRGRGDREEGCGDRHQNAVISSTVFRTVSHHFTPWAEPSRHGRSLDGLCQIVCLKLSPALSFRACPVSACVSGRTCSNSVSYACKQQFIRRR